MIASLAFVVIGLAAGYLLAMRLRPRPRPFRAENLTSGSITVHPDGVRFALSSHSKDEVDFTVSPEDMDRVCRHWTARRGK
mgnify:FL=1